MFISIWSCTHGCIKKSSTAKLFSVGTSNNLDSDWPEDSKKHQQRCFIEKRITTWQFSKPFMVSGTSSPALTALHSVSKSGLQNKSLTFFHKKNKNVNKDFHFSFLHSHICDPLKTGPRPTFGSRPTSWEPMLYGPHGCRLLWDQWMIGEFCSRVRPCWLHAPLGNAVRMNQGTATNPVSSFLYTSMCRAHPDLLDKPVIIGGDQTNE